MARTLTTPQAGKSKSNRVDETGMAALHALRRVFVSFLCQGIVTVKSSAAKAAGPAPTEPASKSKGTKRSADEVNRADIASDRARSLLEQFQSQLLAGLHAKPAPVRLASLRTLMELIRRTPAKRLDTVAASSGAVDVTFRFGDDVFIKVLQRMVCVSSPKLDGELVAVLLGEFADDYDDVRYFLLKCIKSIASQKNALQTNPDAMPSRLGKDAESDLLREVDVKNLASLCVSLLLQTGMPSSTSDMAGKVWCVSAETPSSAASASKKTKSVPVATSTEAAKWLSLHWQHRVFSEAWLSVLRLPMSQDTYKDVLRGMAVDVLPFFPNPIMMCDFLSDSFAQGGVISLLSLEGIWLLMQKHELDYPDFYPKLYSLLTLETLHADYREDFFKKIDMFLSSSYLASYIAAAFAKKMARLAIHSEPPVVLFAIPFIYNILQQHPALTKMVHRNPNGVRRYRVPYRVRTGEELAGIPVYEAAEEDSTQFEPFGDDKIADAMVKPDDASEAAESVTSSSSDSDSEGEEEETEVSIAPAVTARPKEAAPHQQLGVDPFDETMLDMSKCGALDSSLWELTVLACHYNPTISTLARVFSTKWAQQRKPVERSAGASYESMLETELKRTRSVRLRDDDIRLNPGQLLGDDL